MKVTIKHIAQICKVSEGTVDRALNNRVGIKQKTKTRILKVAKELNYLPNHLARGLAKGQTFTIGIVLFDVENQYFAQLMTAMEVRARELGYIVFPIFTHHEIKNEIIALQQFKIRQVDGIIIFSVQMGNEFDEQLEAMQVPVIAIGNRISNAYTYVGIDEKESMKDAVKHVLDKGYEQIIYVCPPLVNKGKVNLYTLEERLAGCMETLQENGKPEPIVITDKNYTKIINDIDWNSPIRRAVVCPADLYALEVLRSFEKNNIRVPEQAGIMGFDNIDMLKYINPRLCTVQYPAKNIAITAVNQLIEEINGNQNRHMNALLIKHQVVEGESL